MVGHTGVLSAAVKAVEVLDECLGRVVRAAQEAGARVLITADHGNLEIMADPVPGNPTPPIPRTRSRSSCSGKRSRLREGGSLRMWRRPCSIF